MYEDKWPARGDLDLDAREFFDIQSGYINTVATEPVATPRSVAIQIDLAIPAATAGASAQDFYQNNVVVTRAFSSGKNNQPRPQPQVLPRGEISLGGACP
jgi:hypothetical protein